MRIVGLFSGIGGFELGFQRTGHETLFLCDKYPFSKMVLRKRFPEIPLHSDITEVSELPKKTDIVCAGFPCQNLSMAGNKAGVSGDDSKIVMELFRLLRRRPVPWVVIENVYFMLHLNKGAEIARILKELEDLGYSWAYRVVDSRGFSLAQRRRRLFIVACLEGDPRNVLLADDAGRASWPEIDLAKPVGFYWTEGRSGHGLTGNAIPPLKTGSKLGIPSAPAVLLPNGRVVTPTIEAAEMLQGFPRRWTSPIRPGNERHHRWRLVGNAVSVPVAEWIGRRLADPGTYDSAGDEELSRDRVWPNAAYKIDKVAFSSKVSSVPLMKRLGALASFDADQWPDLSRKALEGFIRRAREPRTRLRYPAGFLEALEARLPHLIG